MAYRRSRVESTNSLNSWFASINSSVCWLARRIDRAINASAPSMKPNKIGRKTKSRVSNMGAPLPVDGLGRRWHTSSMPKRSSKPKRPRDVNQLAKAIVDQATSEAAREPQTADDGKGH
jgi:hypothetical protein